MRSATVTNALHPPQLVAQRVAHTLPALMDEAVMQWRARERSRIRVIRALDEMEADACDPFAKNGVERHGWPPWYPYYHGTRA
jgi:hypothetical protein